MLERVNLFLIQFRSDLARARRSSTSYFRGRSGIGIGFPAKSRRCFVTGLPEAE
jgi:hypothetical protein